MKLRFLAIVSLIVLAPLLLLACSTSDDADDPTATSTVIATESAAAGEARTPSVAPAGDATAPATASVAEPTASTPDTASPTVASPAPSPTPSVVPVPEGTTTVEIDGQTVELPEGYTMSVYAEDLGAARFMALDDAGVLHVTDRRGRVLRLPDADGDGQADAVETVLDGLNNPHGITFHEGALWIAEETQVIRATDDDGDGTYDTVTEIIDDLPEGGHWSRTIRFGPDGMLYVSVGSSCNVCEEDDPRRAAIWRYNPDGSGGEPFAVGLRNAVGMTFHPATGALWVTNNGRDGMGDDVPPETINQPNQGDDFGWPRCHAGDVIDPQFGSEDACEGVAPPAVLMQAHSAPLGLTFADGEMLAPFDGDLFVAFHGSWNRSEPTGYKVVRIPFENGQPAGEAVDFATGWLLPDGDRWGRPVDVIVASDGSLMISDDEGGRIFRVAKAT